MAGVFTDARPVDEDAVAWAHRPYGQHRVRQAGWYHHSPPQPEDPLWHRAAAWQFVGGPARIVEAGLGIRRVVSVVPLPLPAEIDGLGGKPGGGDQCEQCNLHGFLRTVTTVMSSFWPH